MGHPTYVRSDPEGRSMKAFSISCILGLLLALAILAHIQLEQRDQIAALESQVEHHYELILFLYGDDLEPPF
jgi:hypothetical protein